MRILIMPTEYPDERSPVANPFIYEQAEQLSKQGNEITILHLFRLPSKEVFNQIDKVVYLKNDGFAYRYVTESKTFLDGKLNLVNRSIFMRDMKRLFAYVYQNQKLPDVIYAHFSCWAGYAAIKIGRKYHIPVVCLEHCSIFMKPTVQLGCCYTLREVVENSQAFLCVSSGLCDAIKRICKTRKELKVIGNMVGPMFSYHETHDDDVFVFLAICNLSKRKGIDLLISAFQEAFCPNKHIELRVCGAGPEFEVLQAMARKTDHRICFTGKIMREQCLREYINCDCFVLPSRAETFGLAYREAMAVGRPVITTSHGGFDQRQWDERFGEMIPIDDYKALVCAMQKVYSQINTYNGKSISEETINRYSPYVIGKQIQEVLYRAAKDYKEGKR